MSDAIKTLGQSYPSAATLTTLYTAPASTSAVVSSLVCCNKGSEPDEIRVSVAVGGAADADKQYLYYDLPVPAKDTFVATLGASLAAADVLRCYSRKGTTAFNAFGV